MFLFCCSLIGAAYYFEKYQGMNPCPLCVFQRIGVVLVGVWFLIRAIHGPNIQSRWHFGYSIAGLVSAILGSIPAIRHVYIKSLPEDQVPACGPSLDYLRDMLPVHEIITTVLAGDGECAKDNWTLLGLSMPAWVLLFFIGVAILMIINMLQHHQARQLENS
jgi:disulfide bond formation protein DsbB